jgi:replicative DNA helicase
MAEEALLGAILFDNITLERVNDRRAPLRAEDFSVSVHRRVFSLTSTLIAAGEVADSVTLLGRLATEEGSRREWVPILLGLLEAAAPLTVQAQSYAGIVRDLAQRRAIYNAAQAAIAMVTTFKDDEDAEDILPEAVRLFDGAVTSNASTKSIGEAAAAFRTGLDEDGARAIPTGYDTLDRRLGGGLFRGDLVILAGRPSMGKTSVALNVARNGARRGAKIGIVSQEMSAESLAMRSLSAQAYAQSQTGSERFSYSHLRSGAPNVSRHLIDRAVLGLRDLPIEIDDRAGLSVEQIEWSARSMRRKLGGLDVLVIDYLQILDRPTARGRNDAAILGEMTTKLKQLARKLNVAVVLLSQLSRAAETRDDKRPQLSDLRESGAIEQDADVVIGVFRESYYLERREPPASAGDEKMREWQEQMDRARDQIELLTLKQRNGPCGTDKLQAHIQYDLVLNIAR